MARSARRRSASCSRRSDRPFRRWSSGPVCAKSLAQIGATRQQTTITRNSTPKRQRDLVPAQPAPGEIPGAPPHDRGSPGATAMPASAGYGSGRASWQLGVGVLALREGYLLELAGNAGGRRAPPPLGRLPVSPGLLELEARVVLVEDRAPDDAVEIDPVRREQRTAPGSRTGPTAPAPWSACRAPRTGPHGRQAAASSPACRSVLLIAGSLSCA